MLEGVGSGEIIAVVAVVFTALQMGLRFSGYGYVAYSLYNWAAPKLGYEPFDVHAPKYFMESLFQILFTPIGRTVRPEGQSKFRTDFTLYVCFAALVTVLSVVLQISLIFSATAANITMYQFSGLYFEPLPVYHSIVGVVSALAFSLMSYSNLRIREQTKWA